MKNKKPSAKRQPRQNAPTPPERPKAFIHSIWGGFAIAILGIVVGQAILYGPSLIGRKILLPLDLLAVPGSYLPRVEPYKDIVPHNVTLGDLVFGIEPARRAVHSELSAGQPPLWSPNAFAGAPAFRIGLSPAWLPAYLIASPVVLAWTQMLVALIAGLGMYYFCRRILGLGPWPSIIAAWCYPLTGAYVLWVGQWLPAVMCWLPWSLAAVDRAVRAPRGWGGPAVCGVTVVLLLGGAIDVGAQVLLVSGLYAIWCMWDEYASRAFSLKGLQIAGTLALAWVLGFAGSMWFLVPAWDYGNTGSRVIHRSEGAEERPPVGFQAIPQAIFPDIFGSAQHGSVRIGALTLQESSAMAYAGTASCLILAPLAWFSRKRRSAIGMLIFLTVFPFSWALNVPLIVPLLRLPVLKMMSHNRLAFVAAFALIALAAIGLEVLLRREMHRRWWFAIPAILLAVLCIWCIHLSFRLPEPLATSQLEAKVQHTPIGENENPSDVAAEIRRNFRRSYEVNAAFCGAGAAIWLFLILGSGIAGWFVPALTALLAVELVYFGYGFAAQTDPALYFPKIPILERIVHGPPGRVIGFNCLPANVGGCVGLKDVRGYDGVDPIYIVELLKTARDPQLSKEMPYAATQFLSPFVFKDPETGSLRIKPVLDLLNVRYVIFRGTPPSDVKPSMVGDDYWAFVNDRAMPRAFVPRHVQSMSEGQHLLNAMDRPDFDPAETAYVEQPVELPDDIEGTVEFVEDTSRRVTLQAHMKTSGMVVLADRWDSGWRAYVNNAEVPIIRADYAIRGVVVGPGTSTIRFEYFPSGFFMGLAITLAGGICLLVWACFVIAWRRRAPNRNLSKAGSNL